MCPAIRGRDKLRWCGRGGGKSHQDSSPSVFEQLQQAILSRERRNLQKRVYQLFPQSGAICVNLSQRLFINMDDVTAFNL